MCAMTPIPCGNAVSGIAIVPAGLLDELQRSRKAAAHVEVHDGAPIGRTRLGFLIQASADARPFVSKHRYAPGTEVFHSEWRFEYRSVNLRARSKSLVGISNQVRADRTVGSLVVSDIWLLLAIARAQTTITRCS